MWMNRGNEYEKKTMIFTTSLKKAKIKSYITMWEQINLKNILKTTQKQFTDISVYVIIKVQNKSWLATSIC